jgi:Rod binding domain-containing protein
MTGLPPIDSSLIPADVRAGGKDDVKLYETALSFEQMLTQQLSQSITSTLSDSSSDGSDDDGSSSDAATNMYDQMLPDAFANGITSAGGLGLAQQLYTALKGQDSK